MTSISSLSWFLFPFVKILREAMGSMILAPENSAICSGVGTSVAILVQDSSSHTGPENTLKEEILQLQFLISQMIPLCVKLKIKLTSTITWQWWHQIYFFNFPIWFSNYIWSGGILSACILVPSQKWEEGIRVPETRLIDDCELPCVYQELKPGHFKDSKCS